MQNWNITPDHPVSLTLANDARTTPVDILNDQIWEFKVNNPEAPFVSLETTFGLRARLCRIFPSFTYQASVVSDPAKFSNPVIIHRYFPNYLEISFKPFSHINVRIEYWVPASQVVAGRIIIANSSHTDCTIEMEWAELLLPSPDGFRMTINEIDMGTILAGKTSDLEPVLFLTGGAQSGKNPYPSLNKALSIPSKGEKITQWAHVALNNRDASLALAKEICTKNWDAEFGRITRINSKSVEIQTGNKTWDTAFLLSQVVAHQLYLRSDKQKGNQAFITLRQPDQGFSRIGDGSDYENLRNGITAHECHYLMMYVLPVEYDLLKSVFENFLETQAPSGEIDMSLRPGGQKSNLLAMPIFAVLLKRLYEMTGDPEEIRNYFPRLVIFFRSWFSSLHDRDGDQFPEWDHPTQTGYEDRPLFSKQDSWFTGIDISSVESPDLISYLYLECQILIKLAHLLKDKQSIEDLSAILLHLKSMVETTWSDQTACYHYRDRDTHETSLGEMIGGGSGESVLLIQREFDIPIRPVIKLELIDEIIPLCLIYIHGTIASGIHRVESIQGNMVHWHHQFGIVTSEYSYKSIEKIEVRGIRAQDSVIIKSIDLSSMDLSLAAPLWAGIPSKERAKILINLSLMNKKKFLSPYGLRTYPGELSASEQIGELAGINIPGNSMIIDGLLQYGELRKAAEVFQRFMKAVIQSIQQGMILHQSYHSETGKSMGSQNSVTSLVPVALFLKILGIQIHNPFKVAIYGYNPFPWPVTVKFQGLIIIKHEKKSLIIFPDGHNVTINNDHAQIILRETNATS